MAKGIFICNVDDQKSSFPSKDLVLTESNDTILVVDALVIGAITIEEELANMKAQVEKLVKENKEKEAQIKHQGKQIDKLTRKFEKMPMGEPSCKKDGGESEDDVQESSASSKTKQSKRSKKPHEDLSNPFTIQQLQHMISNVVKRQLGKDVGGNGHYTKPYTKRIELLQMPSGYQPPKFMQFDGRGNPKQHVAHFIETCNNAGIEKDLLVKQFVRTLKDVAFDWYTDLSPESIDDWGQMEDAFLNHFYNTRRTMSMIELSNTNQLKNEPVVDYIDRWRTLSLQCKDQLSEAPL